MMAAPLSLLVALATLALLCAAAPRAGALSLDAAANSRRDFLRTAAAGGASSLLAPGLAGAADSGSGRTVCVTGANGYIGLHCVKELLGRGYNVKAAVRSTSPAKTKYLSQIASELGATDRLDFATIDLFDVNSLVDAGRGCESMLHLASPYSFSGSGDPVKTIVEPAVAGATNAVRAAEELKLKKLVACGSVFGMVGSVAEKGFDHVYGTQDVNGFNTPGGCAYAYSKRASQEESIALARERGVDLITLNVGQVGGPALSPEQSNPSWEGISLLANKQPGGKVLSCTALAFVDVRDVALAHVNALTLGPSSIPRRYVVAARRESPTYVEIAELFADILPERGLPTKVEAVPPAAQKLVVQGLKLGDKGLGELLEGVSVPPGKTLLVDIDPMKRDLVPTPRSVRTTLADFVENQLAYGHVV